MGRQYGTVLEFKQPSKPFIPGTSRQQLPIIQDMSSPFGKSVCGCVVCSVVLVHRAALAVVLSCVCVCKSCPLFFLLLSQFQFCIACQGIPQKKPLQSIRSNTTLRQDPKSRALSLRDPGGRNRKGAVFGLKGLVRERKP